MSRGNGIVLSAVVAVVCSSGHAAEPLGPRIDRLIAQKFDGDAAPATDDAAFVRRVYLDLAGRIPTAADARSFLEDPSPQKRRELVDRLLNSPGYAERMANLFDVMLMERRGANEEWYRFLLTCFRENRPWDRMVNLILNPRRDDENLRGAAWFYTRRLEKVGQQMTDYAGLTRDVGRMFLGVDLQCAECHNHLFIDDYRQKDFQGLLAVYQNVSIRRESFPAINEQAMTAPVEFVSVLTAEKGITGPRIPFGTEFDIPEPPPADPKAKKKQKRPDPDAPPAFSALQLIADNLPSSENALFRRNIVNRLWFSMMGRGLVEPLDEFHSENPASHPELLALLASEFAAQDFNIRWLVRELVLTETWQRSSRMPSGEPLPPPQTYRLGHQRRLTAEQLFWSTLQATGNLERLAPQEGAEPGEEFSQLKDSFIQAFATEPGEEAVDYTPGVKQALYLLNDSKFLALLEPQPGNLTHRLQQLPDDQVADELYLSVFSRLPDDREKSVVTEYLRQSPGERDAILRRFIWAMLTSIEFAVNH